MPGTARLKNVALRILLMNKLVVLGTEISIADIKTMEYLSNAGGNDKNTKHLKLVK